MQAMQAQDTTRTQPAALSRDEDGRDPSLFEAGPVLVCARDLGEGLVENDFHVPAMHCAGCMRKIEKGLEALDFVDAARANLSTKRVSVRWRPDHDAQTESGRKTANARADRLTKAFSDLGFDSSLFDIGAFGADSGDRTSRQLAMAVGVAGFGAANIMLLSVSVWSGADAATRDLFHLLSGMIAIPIVAYSGQPFFQSALRALRARSLNMDVPISLAVILALCISIHESLTGGAHAYFDASVTLLFFLLVGRTLDNMMREKARGAINRLSQMAAKGAALVQPDGSTRYVPLDQVAPGMDVLVAAGERVPVDGCVQSGASDIDRSLVTGESLPVIVETGGLVEAGTLNLTGPLKIRATKTAATSFLAEIVSMMEAAEQGKATYSRIADRAAAIYAPAVHLVGLATFIGWMIVGGDWHASILTAIAVLIITCPCALGLAVPIVHVVAANRLLKHGIMVKDGAALEKLREVDLVVLDKTGTLTRGTPRVERVDGPVGPDLAGAIAAIAGQSTHPSAGAVAAHFEGAAPTVDIADLREVPGSGIVATIDGKPARLGRRAWAEEILPTKPESNGGRTQDVVFTCADGTAIGFGLRDSLRPHAKEAISALKAAGLDVSVLSGDNADAVRATADALGIESWKANQTPTDKIEAIDRLQQSGRKVLMVGDGINDAPALAAGHVSMSPASGSDVGRLAADLVFLNDRLDVVPFARAIAQRTDSLVKQNFAIALIYNCIAIPLAVMGYATPLVAAIAMSGSSIIVVANSMRLATGTRLAGGEPATEPVDHTGPNHRSGARRVLPQTGEQPA